LVRIEFVGRKLNFTGNSVVNNSEPDTGDDNYYDDDYYNYENQDEVASAVIELTNFQQPLEVSVWHNQFNNPHAMRELSVDMRLPHTFILDLGFNFWDHSNYSAVIQRYVC